MNDVLPVVIIVLLVVNLIGLVMVGARVSNQSTDARALERRLTTLEARVENLPTHRDLTSMGREVSDVMEAIATLTGQTEAMNNMLKTIQQYLLDREKNR